MTPRDTFEASSPPEMTALSARLVGDIRSPREAATLQAILAAETGSADPVDALVKVGQAFAASDIGSESRCLALLRVLQAVEKNTDNPARKAVAQLGAQAGSHCLSDRAAATVREIALNHLDPEETWSTAGTVARVALEMAQELRPEDVRAVFSAGFEVIQSLPVCSDEMRELAGEGLKASGRSSAETLERRKEILAVVVDYDRKDLADLEAQLEGRSPQEIDLTLHEDELEINGYLVDLQP